MSLLKTEPSPADLVAHRLKPLVGKPAGSLVIHEIYRSIQGESDYAGLPCVFVRLTACQMRCVYCDTPHAFNQGETMTLDAVLSRVREWDDPLVEVTGGEPLLQPESLDLMRTLADEGRTVLLETGGGLSIADVDRRVHVILDVKTPDSGEAEANLVSNYDHLKPTDETKYVVCSDADVDWAVGHVRTHRMHERCSTVFSPSFGEITPARLAERVLESGLPIRMRLQLHKYVWHPQARGV